MRQCVDVSTGDYLMIDGALDELCHRLDCTCAWLRERYIALRTILPLTESNYIDKINDIMARPPTSGLSKARERIIYELGKLSVAGEPGTLAELAERLKLAGVSSLAPTLMVMERNGFVKIRGGGKQGKRRIVELTPKGKIAAGINGVPVLGSIPAGPLSEVLQYCDDVDDLGTALPHQPGDFILVVSGMSMIGDGILPGDKVLLRPNVPVRNGEIAAVHVGVEYMATLKHVIFNSPNEQVILRASNPDYPDLHCPGRDVQVVGVYRGLIRCI